MKAAEAAKNKEKTREQLETNAAFFELWEKVGFEFIGVWRERTDKPFFFLRQNGDYYWLVGHAGNLLVERSYKCSIPDAMSPEQFTVDQIEKAAEEILSERHRQAIERAQSIINMLRDSVSPPDDVYVGPAMVRIEDVIPAHGEFLLGMFQRWNLVLSNVDGDGSRAALSRRKHFGLRN